MAEEGKKEKKFYISKTIKGKHPSLPFIEIKEYVLGKNYNLSLVFVGDQKIQTLNRIYKNKNKTTNVLAFPLSKDEGEIFINLRRAEIECKSFGEKFENFVGFLFIHALLHLKEMKHSSKMESEERRIRNCFGI